MSRIEKALERAALLRGTASKASSASAIAPHPAVPENVDAFFEIGEPAIVPSLVDRHIVCITDPQSLASEQYRKLRARLFRTTRKDALNTLMIASSEGGEGKTITAINLAVAIAHEIDHTVLLVDADLRNPSVHRYLGLEPRPGLSDYLKNEAALSDILVRTGIGKLVLLPAGTPAENPAELAASDRMRNLVQEMKHRYRDRIIIFDSAPILLAADTLSLASYMDGILFVVQADQTSPKTAASALALFKGYNVLGSVFNNVPSYLGQTQYPSYRSQGRYTMESQRKSDGDGKGPGPSGEAARG
jgi:protein-tyrosine kinase